MVALQHGENTENSSRVFDELKEMSSELSKTFYLLYEGSKVRFKTSTHML